MIEIAQRSIYLFVNFKTHGLSRYRVNNLVVVLYLSDNLLLS